MDFLALIPGFGNMALTVLAFVAALSVIVTVHEYGHYIVGRWSGIHAEVFSLGFGPQIWSRVDGRGTRWQVAALPLGGYVKFLGDSNAASGRDEGGIARLDAEAKRRTLHGAPLWARAATVAAGPVFNFLFSILVFSGFYWVNGVAAEAPVVGEMKTFPHEGAPLLPGDRVLTLDGVPVATLADFLRAAEALPPAATAHYGLERAGQQIELTGPFPYPPLVEAVQPMSAAAEAGIAGGDLIRAIDGAPGLSFGRMREIFAASGARGLSFTIARGAAPEPETVEIEVAPRRADLPLPEGGFETRWLVGLTGGLAFTPELRQPGGIESLRLGAAQLGHVVATSLSGLRHMVTGAISSCNLQGPLGIAETSGAAASQGAASFLWFLAVLSTAVGLMNLFPVPVLDGGHLLFHAWEAVTGKPPSERALRGLMTAGLAVLLTMMVFALGNDLFCP
ncbi:MAG: RIP metalloprotease RseP [Gemmobacter sp.]|nr:RIP metalloprotease RseP [Gemmobacter sp.]